MRSRDVFDLSIEVMIVIGVMVDSDVAWFEDSGSRGSCVLRILDDLLLRFIFFFDNTLEDHVSCWMNCFYIDSYWTIIALWDFQRQEIEIRKERENCWLTKRNLQVYHSTIQRFTISVLFIGKRNETITFSYNNKRKLTIESMLKIW